MRFVRNPNFREWSRAARPDGYPDEILLTASGEPGAVTAIEQGDLDVSVLGRIPPAQLERLAVRYPGRLHVAPLAATFMVALNTTRPPFDRLDARRAVAYAIDREALVRIGGGPRAAQPTCQVLPPNFPAYEPYCPYTRDPRGDGVWRGPDLGGGQAPRGALGHRGRDRGGLDGRPVRPGGAVRRGTSAAARVPGHRAEVSVEQWMAAAYGPEGGVTAPGGALSVGHRLPGAVDVLRPAALRHVADPARFCDPAIDRQMDEALALQATDPAAADELWAKIDRALTDQAAWIGYATPRKVNFVGSRVGNFQFHPVWWTLLDQLWVR